MVPKAGYPTGRDLTLDAHGLVHPCGQDDTALTFAGIALYTPDFFTGIDPDLPAPLLPLFLAAMARGHIRGEIHDGLWLDVGTAERLAMAGKIVAERHPA
jgi:MurNAc alpha-1-phosphate uridylyltransferase